MIYTIWKRENSPTLGKRFAALHICFGDGLLKSGNLFCFMASFRCSFLLCNLSATKVLNCTFPTCLIYRKVSTTPSLFSSNKSSDVSKKGFAMTWIFSQGDQTWFFSLVFAHDDEYQALCSARVSACQQISFSKVVTLWSLFVPVLQKIIGLSNVSLHHWNFYVYF